MLGTDPDNPTTALDYYHNTGGQIIEVRKGEDTDPLEQYVWSPRYVHAPILRWRDENTDGENLETLYYCNDANMNVTALVNASGTVVERYLYDPYGKVLVCDGSWTPREGNASAYSNEVLFTGHRLDPESGLYYTLWRHYHPTLGDWTGRDPKGYVDGMGLYEYVGANPLARSDAWGLELWERKSGFKFDTDAFLNRPLETIAEENRKLGKLARDFDRREGMSEKLDDAAVTVATFQPGLALIPAGLKAFLGVCKSFGSDDAPDGLRSEGQNEGRNADNGGQAKATVQENAEAGRARQERVDTKLEGKFPDASVQKEQYLRNPDGSIAKDPVTGEGRRIDSAVIEKGEGKALVETTSKTADKQPQEAKESRIRESGGTYVRDRTTGKAVDFSKVPTRIIRVK